MKCDYFRLCGNEGEIEVEFQPKHSLPKLKATFLCMDCYRRFTQVVENLKEEWEKHSEEQNSENLNYALQRLQEAHSLSKSTSLEQRNNACPFCGYFLTLHK